jgi:hypothetical protein
MPQNLKYLKSLLPVAAAAALVTGIPAFPVAAQSVVDIFGNKTPQTPVAPDPLAVTLGVRFQAAITAAVWGIRFYRGASTGEGYVVALYDAAGRQLSRAAISGDTCTVPCWETIYLPSPIEIVPGQTYTAAYWEPGGASGSYPDDQGGLGAAVTGIALTALANGGVYTYGADIAYPTGVWNSSNYWIDVVAVTGNNAMTTLPIAVGSVNPLTMAFSPANPSVPCGLSPGATVTKVTTAGGDGNPVTLAVTGSSDFVFQGLNLVVGPNGISQSDCGQTVSVTITATQS